MDDMEWRKTADVAAVVALLSCFVFIFRVILGYVNFWTVVFFLITIIGTAAYILIHMMLKIESLTPDRDSVADQVTDTREFVWLFFSTLVLFATSIGMFFFTGKSVGIMVGLMLFFGTIITVALKIYDIQRITDAKIQHYELYDYRLFSGMSKAEKLSLLVGIISLFLMNWVSGFIILTYAALLVFVIRPIVSRAYGRSIDLVLTIINICIIIFSCVLVSFK